MRNSNRKLPLLVTAILITLAITIFRTLVPDLTFSEPNTLTNLIPIYIQVIGMLLAFWGLIVVEMELRSNPASWGWTLIPVFVICILLEIGSLINVEVGAGDFGFWSQLAGLSFLGSVFAFAIGLLGLLWKLGPRANR